MRVMPVMRSAPSTCLTARSSTRPWPRRCIDVQGLWQDLRFATRVLLKGRWFTLAALTALALGIGANNAVFTIVNGVMLRGLPFQDPDRIMWTGTRDAQRRDAGASLADFDDYQAAQRSFSGIAVTTTVDRNLID